MKRETISELAIALLLLLFLYTALSKLVNFSQFVHDMQNQVFWPWFDNALIVLVPLSEVLICFGLLIKRFQRKALFASLFLMSLFTVYTATVLLHWFDRKPCGCGGVVRWLKWPEHLAFNLFFVIVCIVGLWPQLLINLLKIFHWPMKKGIAEPLK